MPDLTYKSVGAMNDGAGTQSVAQPALASGDYAILVTYQNGTTTPPTVTNYTHSETILDGGGGAHFVYWRRATGTVSATTVSVSTTGSAWSKIVVASGSTAGIGAPTVVGGAFNNITQAYHQTVAITTTDKLAASFAWILAARTQGSLSNQGTITSTNTSRAYENMAGATLRLQTVTSVITSAAGGSVRGTFTGGSAQSITLTVLFPNNPPATPASLALTSDVGELDVSFSAVTGVDGYQIRYKQTGLSTPSTTTQTSAPSHLDRLDQTGPTASTTYAYTWDGTGVRVYVVDTGVRGTHNEFTGRIDAGYSLDATAPWTDTQNHGTAVASVAAGTTYGVAKGATVVPVNDSIDLVNPGDSITAAHLQTVVDWILADIAASGEPGVANFSIGFVGMQGGGTNSTATQTEITRLLDAGVPVIVASGNSGIDVSANVAEDDDRVIWVNASVPSTDARYVGGDPSNYGPTNSIFAPSSGQTAAANTSNSATQTFGYTSGATPMVAGVAAKNKQANPALGALRMQEVLFTQARLGIVTSVPSGPANLLNGNAIITDWSIRDVATSTSFAHDGLGDGTDWDVQVRSYKAGVYSDWSSTVSESTLPGSFSGTATLTGSGALTATGSPSFARTAALTGSGSLTATGVPAVTGTATLTGSGALTATGSPAVSGTATLAGSGALTVSAAPGFSESVDLSGSGALTVAGAPAVVADAALSGSGELTATGAPAFTIDAALSGSGSLTATGTPSLSVSVALAGSGSLVATTDSMTVVDMSGTGTLTVTGAPSFSVTASLTGSGALTITAAPGFAESVTLTGSGVLTASAAPSVSVTVALTGSGALTVFAAIPLRNVTLTSTPRLPRFTTTELADRWAVTPRPFRYTTTPHPDRYTTVERGPRFTTTPEEH